MNLRTIIGSAIISITLSGCTSSNISELDYRISQLEKVPPSLDARTERVLDILIGGPMGSNDQPTKADAALALAMFKRTETTAEIIKQAKSTNNQHFRMKCHTALGLMGAPEAIPYLKSALETDDYEYSRRAAAKALETLTGDEYLNEEHGFESPEKMAERLRKAVEEQRNKEKQANQSSEVFRQP